MDLAEMDKFQAMKARHRRSGQHSFMAVIVQYSLRVLTLGLFLSSPHWLPVARRSVESLLVVSLPGICGVIMRPLPLFVISNAIIIFLFCESKLSRSSLQSPDMYEEYVAQSQNLQKAAASAPKDATMVREEEEASVELENREKEGEEEEEVERESDGEEEEEEEEEGSTPAEEMDKRFEDFIARVNMHRKLEAARMLACCG